MTTSIFGEQRFPGRVALVTGGTRGIGFEIARGLVARGVTTVVAGRDAAAGAGAAAELGARYLPLDLANEAAIASALAQIEADHGRLDILVNNAAIGIPPKPAFEVTATEMRQVYETNVFAVVSTIQAARSLLERSPGGRIVNVSSERGSLGEGDITSPRWAFAKSTAAPGTMAHRLAFIAPPNMAYSTSKTALNAVTQHFAYELERSGSRIKINAAAPGHCKTAFNGFRGHRDPKDGAQIAIWLAVLDDQGPNGGFFSDEGPAPW